MLTPYRRHREKCKHRSRRYKGCFCPIWVQGTLDGEAVRYSLDLTSWEAAIKKIRELELHGDEMLVKDCVERFLDARRAKKLSATMMGKYTRVGTEIKEFWLKRDIRSVKVDDVNSLVQGWKFAPITIQKRLEIVRKFFEFCVHSEWLERNPAKPVEAPTVKHIPTLPFSDQDMEKILWAAESIREAHPKIPKDTPKKLLALVLLMRYSGLRCPTAEDGQHGI